MTPQELKELLEERLKDSEGKPPTAACLTLVGKSMKGIGVRPLVVDQRANGDKVYMLNVGQCERILDRLTGRHP